VKGNFTGLDRVNICRGVIRSAVGIVKYIGSNLYTRKFNQCQRQGIGCVTSSVQIWPGKAPRWVGMVVQSHTRMRYLS
jgi:hypothetical protein